MNMRVLGMTLGMLLFSIMPVFSDHVIVTGGPALRKWEDLRIKEKQHDRWWGNFVRASTLRIDEIKKENPEAVIHWLVFKPSFKKRGEEDAKPYTDWLDRLAEKRGIEMHWFSTTEEFLAKLNACEDQSVETFDYFGHSNRYAFMFEYGADIIAASTCWLHEDELNRIDRKIFARKAMCKSWGCHTGESMSRLWRKHLKLPLIGAKGATNYSLVGHGKMPYVSGKWVR